MCLKRLGGYELASLTLNIEMQMPVLRGTPLSKSTKKCTFHEVDTFTTLGFYTTPTKYSYDDMYCFIQKNLSSHIASKVWTQAWFNMYPLYGGEFVAYNMHDVMYQDRLYAVYGYLFSDPTVACRQIHRSQFYMPLQSEDWSTPNAFSSSWISLGSRDIDSA